MTAKKDTTLVVYEGQIWVDVKFSEICPFIAMVDCIPRRTFPGIKKTYFLLDTVIEHHMNEAIFGGDPFIAETLKKIRRDAVENGDAHYE